MKKGDEKKGTGYFYGDCPFGVRPYLNVMLFA
jgi:hypothetical protein